MILSAAREPCRNSQPFPIGWPSQQKEEKYKNKFLFSFLFIPAREQRKEMESKRRREGKERRTTDLVSRNGQPVVVQGGLLFEGPVKDFLDVVEAESANGRAGQSVGRRRKRGVNDVHPFALVAAFVRAGRRFCSSKPKIKKKRKRKSKEIHTQPSHLLHKTKRKKRNWRISLK